METLKEAKQYLRDNWEKGTDCPCCGQRVQLYKRKVSSTAAQSLILLVKKYKAEQRYYHVTELEAPASGGEFARLRWWGLINEAENDDSMKRTSGYWKPSELGILFVENKIEVPAYKMMYNAKPQSTSEETINIIQALNEVFDYSELMRG